jgi:peptide/nickel transport system substrate-binding protein
MRVRRLMVVPFVLALVAGACGGDDGGEAEDTTESAGTTALSETTVAVTDSTAAVRDTTAPTSTAPGEGDTCTADRAGGSLTVGMASQPASLDPAKIQGAATTGGIELLQFYDALMRYDQETGEYVPGVAESLEPDATFQTWTLTLRPDVTFGNGDPFDAAAVKASIERYMATATGTYKTLAAQIASIAVVDDLTLTISLGSPWAAFPFTLANTPGMIVNTKVAQAAGDGFGSNPTGAGAGPFEFASMAPGEEIVMSGKTDYWGGPVCIEQLRFVPSVLEQGRYEAFETGEFDAVWLRDPEIVQQTEADGIGGYTTYQNVQNVLLFNAGVSESPANDVLVRQAVSHIIDQAQIAERAWGAAGNPTSAVLGENSRYNVGLEGPQVDPAAAAGLIEQAKAAGWDGKLRVVCASTAEDVAITIESQLVAAGIDVELNLVADLSQLIDTVMNKKTFDAACWGMNILDDGLWATLNNNLASTVVGTNFGAFADAEMDTALAALRVADTEDEILAAMEIVQDRWTAAVPGVVLNAGAVRTVYAADVHGIVRTGNSLVFFGGAYVD